MAVMLSKQLPLNVSLKNCWVVLMQDMTPSPTHGDWQPVSVGRNSSRHTAGFPFKVVCASKKDAEELLLSLAIRNWPRPDPKMSDEAYIEWCSPWLRVAPYQAGGSFEVWDYQVYEGWQPDQEDVRNELAHPGHAIRNPQRRKWA